MIKPEKDKSNYSDSDLECELDSQANKTIEYLEESIRRLTTKLKRQTLALNAIRELKKG